jgi:hypothetical protein
MPTTTTSRCDAIIELIDRCLAEYERARTSAAGREGRT